MLELRLLGSLDLRDPSGAEIRPVLQQPKRLALLAYLALTPSGGFRRRDSLVGLFWPDLDGEHARGALRRSLYFLRRACGDDVIISRGEDDVGIRPDALWCDVAAFETALAAGRQAQALELYAGDLLEGFYVAGAPAMEQWLDMERTRLRAGAAKAAWAVADAAGSNGAGIVWARKAVDLAPDEDRGVHRLITLLDRSRRHGGRDPRVRRLRRATRARPRARTVAGDGGAGGCHPCPGVGGTRATPRPARSAPGAPSATRSPALAGSTVAGNVLAVCPFVVRGARDLEYLREGMIDLLSSALDGAGDLRTVDPRAVLAAPLPDLDASGGGDTDAYAVGAGLLVSGTVIRAGDRIRVSASLHRTGHGKVGRVEAQAAGEDGLFGVVDELARGLVTLLSQAPGTYPAPTRGPHQRLLARPQGIPAGRARLPPRPAHPGHGRLRAGSATRCRLCAGPLSPRGTRAAAAMLGPARQACRAANALSGSLAASAQRMLEAQDAWLHGRLALAEQRYGAVVAEHPDNVEAWYLLGDVLFHGNSCRGRSPVEARTALQRALSLDGTHVGALGKLARIAAMEGQDAALDLYVDRVVELTPASEQALTLQALRAFRRGDLGELMRLGGRSPLGAHVRRRCRLADAALFSGRLDAVESIARELIPRVPSAELRALGTLFLAEAALAQDRPDDARKDYEVAGELDPRGRSPCARCAPPPARFPAPRRELDSLQEELERWNAGAELPRVEPAADAARRAYGHIRAHVAGLVAARRGDLAATARWTEELAELVVPDGAEMLTENMLRTLEATLRAGRGDPAGGLHALEGGRTEVWFQYAMASPVFAGVEGRLLRAELLHQQGRAREAAGWLSRSAGTRCGN